MVFYRNTLKSYFNNLFFIIPVSPLVKPLIGYLLGITWTVIFGFNAAFVISLGTLAIIFLLSTYRTIAFTIFLPILLGALLLYRQQHIFNTFNHRWDNTIIDIQAKVQDIVYTHENINQYIVTLSCTHIKEQEQTLWQETNCNLLVYCISKPTFDVADHIAIAQLHYKKPQGSYAAYLLKEGFATSVFVAKLNSNILSPPTYSLLRTLYHYRNTMLCHFKRHMSAQTFALFAALFFGNKIQVKKSLEDYKIQFQVWGISHYLARSGLHMIIITMLLVSLLSLIPIHIVYKRSFAIAISILYHFLSWPSISFLRSLYTVMLYYYCNLLSVPIYALHLFCIICLFVLIGNPAQALFLDFQLSFGLTYALAWFNQIIAQRRLFAQNY